MHGGEPSRTIKEEDAPLVQDATLDEDHLRFWIAEEEYFNHHGIFQEIKVLAEANNENNSTWRKNAWRRTLVDDWKEDPNLSRIHVYTGGLT